MTSSTTPNYPGIDRHGEKYRARVKFPAPWGRFPVLYDTLDEAIEGRAALKRRAKAGLPPTEEVGDPTLGEVCASLLKRKQTEVSPKTKRRLSKDGVDHWTRALRPWTEGELAETPVSLLRRKALADTLLDRALVAPTSARNERQALIAALELAGADGANVDRALLELPLIVVEKQPRHALDALELEWFARWSPAAIRRLVLAQGTIGNRIDELLLAEPEHLTLDGERPTMFVPAANCKEHVAKTIPLTPEEVELAREQLGRALRVVDSSSLTAGCPTTPAGAPRVYMTPGFQVYETGTVRRTAGGPQPWRYEQFARYWDRGCRDAALAWRVEHELREVVVAGRPRPAATPFEWWVDPALKPVDGRRRADDDGRRTITTHDLRATAVTLMRDAGVSEADCAARVGHADAGELVRAIYDKGNRAARAGRALAKVAPEGLRAALGAGR